MKHSDSLLCCWINRRNGEVRTFNPPIPLPEPKKSPQSAVKIPTVQQVRKMAEEREQQP